MALRVFVGMEHLPANFGPSVVTIGNFDGVHAGHQELMKRAVAIARAHGGGWHPTVLTFDPHPSTLVAPSRAPKLLTPLDLRLRKARDIGIEQAVILPFTWDVAKLSAEAFVSDLLVSGLKARAVVVGDNFRFGNKQSGDTAKLSELGEKYGFRTEIVGAVSRRGRIVSSTEIRKLLAQGNVTMANRLLQHPYALKEQVVPGFGIGRTKTVPTLNMKVQPRFYRPPVCTSPAPRISTSHHGNGIPLRT